MAAMRERMISLPDGRRVEVNLSGPEDGAVAVAHTGTPSSGRLYEAGVREGAERGLRHLSYARPGYAGSDSAEGRSVADCAADTAAIADALGIDRFHTLGSSGGGPHALACAALLPERVISAASIAGIAPREAEGLDWYAGMGDENIEEMGLAEKGAGELEPWLERMADGLRAASPDELASALGDLVSDVDRDVLTGEYASFMKGAIDHALGAGVAGWRDDDLAFVRHWGFDLGTMAVPVTIWQGTDDRFVPPAHGRWLAEHVGGAKGKLLDGEGHLSLSISHYGEVLDDLLEAA